MEKKPFINAQWIFVDKPGEVPHDQYYDYKEVFTAQSAKTQMYISVHSQYALWINGQFVDCGQFPDYESRQVYDTLDVTAYVKPGENTLALTQYVAGRAFSTGRPAIPGVIFEVFQEGVSCCFSSEKTLSGPNLRYASLKEEISGQCGYNCAYDATGPETEFSQSVLTDKPYCLVPRAVEKLPVGQRIDTVLKTQGVFLDRDATLEKSRRMQTAYLSTMLRKELIAGNQAVSLWAGAKLCHTDLSWEIPQGYRADGAYFVYDLGTERAGLLDMELEVPEDTQVFVGYGEHLHDLRVRSNVHNRHFCFGFKAKAGKNRFFHPLQRIAGRYLQVHIYGKSGVLNYVGIRPTDYPLTYQSAPVQDGLHKWIWDVGCHTLQQCMHEHYEDCPWREQSLYTLDSRVQMLCGYYAFQEYRFPRESLRTIAQSLRPDGLLELCAPGLVGLNIPCYTAVYLRQVLEYTQYSGDATLAREVFDVMTVIVEKLMERIDENGLFAGHQGEEYWHFYEWRQGMHTLGITEPGFYECPMQAFVADAFFCYDRICQMLNEPAGAYTEAGKKLLEKTHQVFFDESMGAYRTRPQQTPEHELTQALMLCVGGVPEAYKKQVEQTILQEKLIPASLSTTIFTFEALLENPENRAYVLEKIEKIWGNMLKAGAQTFWETEAGEQDFDRSGSLCHGWSAVPVYIFGRYGLGK